MENKEILFSKENLLSNINNIIDTSIPLISNLSNISRIIFESFPNTSWSGFYLYDKDINNLYLGPFQGPIACTIIPFGKGVCGKAIELKTTQLVPNVHKYPGHIACSSLTNSEIVVPIMDESSIYGVIDLDSHILKNYNEEDVILLEKVAKIISSLFL